MTAWEFLGPLHPMLFICSLRDPLWFYWEFELGVTCVHALSQSCIRFVGRMPLLHSPSHAHVLHARPVELARLLVDWDGRFSVTLLVMKLPAGLLVLTDCVQSLSTPISGRIRTINLPRLDFSKLVFSSNPLPSLAYYLYTRKENQKPATKDSLRGLHQRESRGP